MPRRHRVLLALCALALIAAACSESEPESADSTSAGEATVEDTADATTEGEASDTGEGADAETADEATEAEPADAAEAGEPTGDSIVERHAGEPWFMGTIPSSPVSADENLDPVRIGMINQEDTPLGSFPELRFAADAAINWINAELGGIDGHPIELVWCITPFSAEQSQACAQELVQEDVTALVGGMNVMSQSALPVLEQNGIPIIGGIPAGLSEQRSELAFAFSGGTVGGMSAMLKHAADNGADKAVIAYGDFDAFEVSADYAQQVGESLGLEVRLVKFPIVATDFLPVLNQAVEFGAQAVIVAAADAACVPVMQTFRDLGIEGQLYLVGACATETVINASGGAHIGVVFSGEGPPDTDDNEGTIFDEVTDEYNNGPAKAAGTVGFRGMMNLYALLAELGVDGLSSEAITELISEAEDRESFWGHSYTCDGQQVPGLPALCAPQQTLFVIRENADDIEFITDWIDTPELFAAALS